MGQISALWTQTQRSIIPAYNDHVIMLVNENFFSVYGQVLYNGGWHFPSNVKYILRVRCESGGAGNEVTLKKSTSFESNFIAYFNVESVIQDFVKTDIDEYYNTTGHDASDINSIHMITNYHKNKANLRKFTFDVAVEYVVEGQKITIGYFAMPDNDNNVKYYNQSYYFWNAVSDHLDGETFSNILDYSTTGTNRYTLTEFPTDSSLSDDTLRQKIQKTQHHTIGFFNGGHRDHSTDTYALADLSSIYIKLYNANGSLVETASITNNTTNGGWEPVANQFFKTSPDGTRGQHGLLYFGCGPKNLTQAGHLTASNIETGGFYTVEFFDGSSQQAYRPLMFDIIEEDCKGYETIRLAWVNQLGTWDYYNFTKLSTQTFTSNRKTYRQNYGHETNSTSDGWGYKTFNGGLQVFNNTVTQRIECNTDFITEEEAKFLKSCFTSPVVQWATINERGSYRFMPVVVREKDYIVRSNANDKLIQYVLELEVGHNYRVQRT